LDDVCINLATKNNVAIAISFRQILYAYRRTRAKMLEKIGTNISLCNEIGARLVVVSGADSTWDMRDPRQLISIANVLGMDLNKSFSTLTDVPQGIIDSNRRKLEGKIVSKGVELA
jgi:RNase P/RNase MRP subunit p30